MPQLSRDITRKLLTPYGQSAAMQTMGSIAAPLLAGFAISTALLVLQVHASLRWPDAALAFLMLASLLFVTSLQASFNARRFYVPPDEWIEWLNLTTTDARREQLERNLAEMLPTHDRWIEAARITYNLGIVVLFAALAIALVPDDDPSWWRGVAIALPAIGAVGELAWSIAGEVNLRVKRNQRRESSARRARRPAALAPPTVTPLPREASSEPTVPSEPPPGD